MSEKHERLKKKGVRIVRARNHHERKVKKKSSEEGSCDKNNIKLCNQCLGSSGDHPSAHIEPEPVNIEEVEGLKSDTTEPFENQSTSGCEDATLNNEGTSMAASVGSDDCNTSLSNTTSPSSVGGASIVKNNNSVKSPMVRFVADVTAPDLTSFSPGKLSETDISITSSSLFFLS